MSSPSADNQCPIEPTARKSWSTSIGYFLLWLGLSLSWLGSEFKAWLIPLFLVGFGLYELAKQELSILQWESTQGTVLESRTVWLEKGFPSITVRVRYRYVVDGQAYESTRLTTGEPVLFYMAQEAAAFRKRFPPGGPVTVLYAPYAPSEATLIAERSSGPWILLGFGVPYLLVVLYVHWQRRRRAEELHSDIDVPLDAVVPGIEE